MYISFFCKMSIYFTTNEIRVSLKCTKHQHYSEVLAAPLDYRATRSPLAPCPSLSLSFHSPPIPLLFPPFLLPNSLPSLSLPFFLSHSLSFTACDSSCGSSVAATWTSFGVLFRVILWETKSFMLFCALSHRSWWRHCSRDYYTDILKAILFKSRRYGNLPEKNFPPIEDVRYSRIKWGISFFSCLI